MVITGTSGAGKTTVARKLCDVSSEFALVQAVTTREARTDDKPGEFLHVTQQEFSRLERSSGLLIQDKYRTDSYAIKRESVESILSEGRVPVLVITPHSVKNLETGEQSDGPRFLTVFLDAADDVLDKRLKERDTKVTAAMKDQRLADRDCEQASICSLLNDDLNKTVALLRSYWRFRNTGGVLSKRFIQLMIECGTLVVENAELDSIKGASYDLTLGDEHYYGGRRLTLTADEPFILVEPFEFVFVTCKQKFSLPRDVVGRFDISVGLFFQGLILSNGPQVDPGFRGGLWCLLFNTSNDTVQMKRGQHYATIEFCRLVEPTVPYSGQYQDKDQIGDYLSRKASRSPISTLQKDIADLKSEKWWIKILPLGLAAIAIIVAFTGLIIALTRSSGNGQ